MVRLNVPPLSVEQRKKLANRVKELAEEARVAIRNIRRDANKQADLEQTEKILTEDDVATCKDEVQNLTKKFEAQGQRDGRQEVGRDHGGLSPPNPGESSLFPVPGSTLRPIPDRDRLDPEGGLHL